MSLLKHRIVGFVVFLCGMLAGANWHDATHRVLAQPAFGDKLAKLMQENLATLTQLVDARKAEFEAGIATFGVLVEAEKAKLEAEFELEQDPAARIEILERFVELAKSHEADEVAAVEAGATSSTADVFLAKSNRIKAEIALERARRE